MKPELKKRWTDALRSGEYDQTQGWLRDKRGFCCLGVACEVFGPEVGLDVKPTTSAVKDHWLYGNLSDNLPIELIGLLETDGYGTLKKEIEFEGGTYTTLQGLNDAGMSFSEIADIIDEQF